jgi:uncharacterized membrane protein YoaK (UPF0700 family)
MLTRHTPAWVYGGGFVLTVTAGWINAAAWLGMAHQAMSHATGTVSIAAIQLAKGDLAASLKAMTVVLFFFAGSAISGAIVRDPTLHQGRRYGVALMIEAGLLLSALLLFRAGSLAGEYLGAMACGLQNGLATNYSGAVIRTTHMTGIVTDLGLSLGYALHRQKVDWFKFRLWLTLLAGFFTGGVMGGWAFGQWSYDMLGVPAALTGLVGAGYTLKMHRERVRHLAQGPGGATPTH